MDTTTPCQNEETLMKLADLDTETLVSLLYDLIIVHDTSELTEKYGVSIPQWLTIKYKCVACSKTTRSKIQTINMRHASRILTCPFCRKISNMHGIHVEKLSKLTTKDFMSG